MSRVAESPATVGATTAMVVPRPPQRGAWLRWLLFVALALFVGGKRFAPRVPIALLVMIASGALAKITGYSLHGAVVGALPQGLPSFYWPALPELGMLGALVVPSQIPPAARTMNWLVPGDVMLAA